LSIEEKVNEVTKLYYILDAEIHRFKKESGLKCLRSCSRCCNPRVHAALLEFLPLAYWLYKKKLAHDWLIKLNEPGEDANCPLLRFPVHRGNAGRCTAYKFRPLVCRLFGFSSILDKNQQSIFVTCRIIKTLSRENYLKTVRSLDTRIRAPIMKNYYMMLYSIDPVTVQTQYPLKTALRLALEMVLAYFTYRQTGTN
jgi:Fe-S-cluster containining protein